MDPYLVHYPRENRNLCLAPVNGIGSRPAMHPREAELVKMRFFMGMTFEEAASVLGIAVPTAKEWWAYARAWLAVQMKQSA